METERPVEIASTSASCVKEEEDASCSKTPESPSRCKSPGSPIGDDACPICLGAFTDKCAAGSCLHNFCLVCLKEWAKQRPVCPLCKQSFTKILYDIKSETDYKEWVVPVIYPPDINEIGNRGILEERMYRSFSEFLDTAHRRFFSYRSTLLGGPRRRQPNSSQLPINTNALPSFPRGRREHQPLMDHERGSSVFRLSIYTNNVWIQSMPDITGRYRESNPNLYREQPALTHRLVPWITRELTALLPPSRVGVVLSDIMDMIERYSINSREFRRALRPHLGANTRHFVHEFYNFARSPYDMVGHDAAAQYIPRYYVDDTDGDSDDSDVDEVIEIESDGVVVDSEPLDLSSRVAREETIGNDGSVFISSDSEDSVHETRLDEDIHNPEPPVYLTRISSFLPSILRRSSEERNHSSNNLDEPGPSGISSSSSLSVKKESSLQRNGSDSEDCFIIDILKPKKERTPELINISSNSEGEASDRTHWKKKMSKEIEDKHSKSHKKPQLDRTSFSLRFSGTVECQRGEDHTYCTESGSPCNPSSDRTEYEKDLYRLRNRTESRSQKAPRKRWNYIADSDFDSESEEYESEPRKRKNIKKRPRNSRSRSFSPVLSPRKVRKGQKSKVKSSHVTRSMARASSKEKKSLTISSSSSSSSSRMKRQRVLSSKTRTSYIVETSRKPRRRSSSSSSDSTSSSSSSSTTSSSSSSSSSSTSTSSSSSSSTCSSKSSLCSSAVSHAYEHPSFSESAADSDYSFQPSDNVPKKLKKRRPIQKERKSCDKKLKESKGKSSKSSSKSKTSKGGKANDKCTKKGMSRKHK